MKTAKILEIENCFIDCSYAELGCGIASHTIPKDCPLKDASQPKSVPTDEEIKEMAYRLYPDSDSKYCDVLLLREMFIEGATWMKKQLNQKEK